MTIELQVNGMTCGHCVNSVTRAVKSLDPGAAVQVDLPSGRVRVDGGSSVAELTEALDRAGYPAVQTSAATPATASKKAGCCCS